MRIGFVGLGFMGSGMAGHLAAAGHDLWLMAHRNRSFIDPLLARGAHEVKDLAGLIRVFLFDCYCREGTQSVDVLGID